MGPRILLLDLPDDLSGLTEQFTLGPSIETKKLLGLELTEHDQNRICFDSCTFIALHLFDGAGCCSNYG